MVNAKVTTHKEHLVGDLPLLFASVYEAEWNGATSLHPLWFQKRSNNHFYACCTKMLVDKGANINEPNAAGKTTLHKACEQYNLPMAIMLLGLGADPTLEDDEGRTPIRIIQDTHKFDHVPNERREFVELCKAHSHEFGPKKSKSINVE